MSVTDCPSCQGAVHLYHSEPFERYGRMWTPWTGRCPECGFYVSDLGTLQQSEYDRLAKEHEEEDKLIELFGHYECLYGLPDNDWCCGSRGQDLIELYADACGSYRDMGYRILDHGKVIGRFDTGELVGFDNYRLRMLWWYRDGHGEAQEAGRWYALPTLELCRKFIERYSQKNGFEFYITLKDGTIIEKQGHFALYEPKEEVITE